MAGVPPKLVRAIMGLGLVAAGCGGEITGTDVEAGDEKREADSAQAPDAKEDAQVDVRDASTEAPLEARVEVEAEVPDAVATEAAADHWIPVPVK